MNLQEEIEYYCNNRGTENRKYAMECFERFKSKLNSGDLRAATKVDGQWRVHSWVKQGIMLGFRLGVLHDYSINENFVFLDKHTFPPKKFTIDSGVRIVPGGTAVRDGNFVARGVTLLPPCYINEGTYIDEDTIIESHVLIGSCAQIGKSVHIGAGTQIGGGLEPVGTLPVIIEDEVVIGGNCGIYDGTVVGRGALLAPGTILTGSIPVYDTVRGQIYEKSGDTSLTIPAGAVVVPGSRPIESGAGRDWGLSLYAPIIVRYHS
jgi:2,3,4,5-tetrahydropyridine-2,6-dicarboxylate N-succinyltransferase